MKVTFRDPLTAARKILSALKSKTVIKSHCKRIPSSAMSAFPPVLKTLQNSSSAVVDGGSSHKGCWARPLGQPVPHLQSSLGLRATVIWWVCEAERTAQTARANGAIPKNSQRILMKTRKLQATKSNCSSGLPAPPPSAKNPWASIAPNSREKNPFCIQQSSTAATFQGHLGDRQGTH